MSAKTTKAVILSPFAIIAINIIVAIFFGRLIGKWSFIPLILIEWCLFIFFILKYGTKEVINTWLKKPQKNWGWNIVAIIVGLIPLPIFLKFNYLLAD